MRNYLKHPAAFFLVIAALAAFPIVQASVGAAPAPAAVDSLRPTVSSAFAPDDTGENCVGSVTISSPRVSALEVSSVTMSGNFAGDCQPVVTGMEIALTDGTVCALTPTDDLTGAADGSWTPICSFAPQPAAMNSPAPKGTDGPQQPPGCRYYASAIATHWYLWTSSTAYETADNKMSFMWDTCANGWLDGYSNRGLCNGYGPFYVRGCAYAFDNPDGTHIWSHTQGDFRFYWWNYHSARPESHAYGKPNTYDYSGSCPAWGTVPQGSQWTCRTDSSILAAS